MAKKGGKDTEEDKPDTGHHPVFKNEGGDNLGQEELI